MLDPKNKLNQLSAQEWLRFTKTGFNLLSIQKPKQIQRNIFF